MKVLVATTQTQGQRKNDFCWVPEGELVMPHFECDGETVDGSCGCRRSLSGVASGKSTTTVKVVELDETVASLAAKMAASLTRGGWGKYMSPEDLLGEAMTYARSLADIAARFAVGAVLERRGDKWVERNGAPQMPAPTPNTRSHNGARNGARNGRTSGAGRTRRGGRR